MRNNPYVSPRRCRTRDYIYSGNRYLATGWQRAGRCDADGGRLSSSIGSQQTEDLARLDREIDAINGDDTLLFLIDFGQAPDFDDHVSFALARLEH